MSEGVEWALHGVTLLAALPAGATLPGKALAEFHGVSESYLLKHLQSLTAAGILESVPGPKGGYRLARPAHEVTVLDVVVAVEGPQPAFRCTEIRQRGPTAVESASYQTPCGINALMLRAEAAWQQVLRSQTVADLLVVAMEGIGRRRAEKAAGWLQQNARS